MTAVQMLQKLLIAQVQAHRALGAAIEELALWADQNGGSLAAANARNALDGLDQSETLISCCLDALEEET